VAIKDSRSRQKQIAIAALFGVGVALYVTWFGRWQSRWGASDYEQNLSLPGDDIVSAPTGRSTRAITIYAAPEDIWPWLVQMGKGRGGLYSYDWLDIAFGYLSDASSERVLPEFQSLKEGDVIPMGKDECSEDDFYVHIVEPNRALVIGANDAEFRNRVSWAMVLVPIASNETRLIVRVSIRLDKGLKGAAMNAVLEPASFIMLRKQMLNLKRLAEQLRLEQAA
jgi:hypothetical protein